MNSSNNTQLSHGTLRKQTSRHFGEEVSSRIPMLQTGKLIKKHRDGNQRAGGQIFVCLFLKESTMTFIGY